MGAHSFWPALYPVPWRIAEWGDDVRFIFGRSSIVARRDVSRWAMFNKVASKHLSPVELQLFILIVSTVIVAASAVAGGQEIRLTSAPTRGMLVARAQLFFFMDTSEPADNAANAEGASCRDLSGATRASSQHFPSA